MRISFFCFLYLDTWELFFHYRLGILTNIWSGHETPFIFPHVTFGWCVFSSKRVSPSMCPSACSSTSTWRACQELRKEVIPWATCHATHFCHVLCFLSIHCSIWRPCGYFLLLSRLMSNPWSLKLHALVLLEKLARFLRWWCQWSGLRR